jgi:predicted MFS family arabinose efflux permease
LPDRSELKLLLGAVAAYCVGYLGSNLMPILVTTLLDGTGLDEQAAGLLGSIELTVLAIGGAAIAGFGFAASANAGTFTAMVVGRLIIGAGAGVAIAAANATLASARDPDRMFAFAYVLGGALAAVLIAGFPKVTGPWGYQGGFLLLAAVSVVALPFMLWIPRGPAERASSGATRAPFNAAAVLTMAAMLIYSLGEQAVWAFMAEIGVRAKIPLEQVGLVAAATGLAGLAGAAFAGWLGTRLGRSAPLAIALSVSALSRWGFIYASSPLEYTVMSIVWGLSFFFVSPYIMGAAATLDREGRWTVAVGAMANFGYAFGPGVAGGVLAHWGQPALAILAVASSAGALAMLIPVTLRQDQTSRT